MSAKTRGIHGALQNRYGVPGNALFAFIASTVAVAISGLAAFSLKQPLLFPSIGPSVLLFFERPLDRASSPRNAVIGHVVAIIVAVVALLALGLWGKPNVLIQGFTIARVVAAALSVGLTTGILVFFRANHPPAAATTLLVSLGLLATTRDILMIFLGVMLVTVVSWLINRAAGVPVPVWVENADAG